jgi:hypothetical protein
MSYSPFLLVKLIVMIIPQTKNELGSVTNRWLKYHKQNS